MQGDAALAPIVISTAALCAKITVAPAVGTSELTAASISGKAPHRPRNRD
jgi:hypothetical protein